MNKLNVKIWKLGQTNLKTLVIKGKWNEETCFNMKRSEHILKLRELVI